MGEYNISDYKFLLDELLNSSDIVVIDFIRVIFIIIAAFVAIAIILYLFQSFGLYKMANTLDIRYSWISFLPIANLYIMGKIVPTIEIGNFEINNMEYVLPWSNVICLIISINPVLGLFISLIPAILYYYAVFYLFEKYASEKASAMTKLSIILPFMAPIYIFLLRNEPSRLAASQQIYQNEF